MYLPECNGTKGYTREIPPAVYLPDAECEDEPCIPVWVGYTEEHPHL